MWFAVPSQSVVLVLNLPANNPYRYRDSLRPVVDQPALMDNCLYRHAVSRTSVGVPGRASGGNTDAFAIVDVDSGRRAVRSPWFGVELVDGLFHVVEKIPSYIGVKTRFRCGHAIVVLDVATVNERVGIMRVQIATVSETSTWPLVLRHPLIDGDFASPVAGNRP